MKKKSMRILLALSLMLLMGGCAFGNKAVSENTIIVDKDGIISGIIVEEFQDEDYEQEELEQLIEEKIATFNQGGEQIKLEKFEVSEGKTYVHLSYQTAQDYKEFNNEDLFSGSVSDAGSAGYEFVDVKSVKEGESGLDAGSVSQKSGMKILIFEEPVAVRVAGTIAYVSDGVTVTGKKEAKADGEGLFYVLYE